MNTPAFIAKAGSAEWLKERMSGISASETATCYAYWLDYGDRRAAA